ncbi:MAG TPA: OB-fold domain-containing protein [Acidimicrobiales bacterium]|jgi:hypothetical protein|nr:OB-fold domain-containing protein [Acidimicrobiales bacterium]
MPRAIPPNVGHDDAFFWEGAAEGKLLLQRCADCRTICHPPLPMCPVCQSLRHEPFAASGRGSIYSWIRSKHPTEPDAEPRIVVLVELEEGVRLVSNLRDTALEDVHTGMAVQVVFDDLGGFIAPQFQPVVTGA